VHLIDDFSSPMKTILRSVSLVSAIAFALAAMLQFSGLAPVPGVHPTVLIGGLVVSCLLALMLRDYARKPAFRVRRSVEAIDAGPTVNRPTSAAPDWTYTTRSK
jgi:hypothetical protein